jgi:hypothetical protein
MQPSSPHPWTLTTGKHGMISVRSIRVRFVRAFLRTQDMVVINMRFELLFKVW